MQPFILLVGISIVHRSVALTYNSTTINHSAEAARARPWTWRSSGLCGASCDTVRRLSQMACKDNLYVAWTAHVGWEKNKQYPEQNLQDEITQGRVSHYKVNANQSVTLISDTAYNFCNEMGDITANPDCTVISALCRSSLEPDEISLRPVYDWLNATDPGRKKFGWWQQSNTNLTSDKYRIIDKGYLLEWDSSSTAKAPSLLLLLSRSLGGWVYGHYSIVFDYISNVYIVDFKTTITSDSDPVWHEGATLFAINRTLLKSVEEIQAWGCGRGHTTGNALTFNDALGRTARYCWADACGDDSVASPAWGISYGAPSGSVHQISCISTRDVPSWRWNGGPGNMISRGENGFLAVAVQNIGSR